MDLIIESLQNPRVKALVRLQGRQERRAAGLVPVEGWHELNLALQAGAVLRSLYYVPEAIRPGEELLLAQARQTGAELIRVTMAVLKKVVYREHPDAWLGVVEMPDFSLEAFEKRLAQRTTGRSGLLVLAEGVEKPGNIGAILRSIDAAGADGLLAVDCRTDLANPNVVRASKGTVFALPCVELNNQAALDWLKKGNWSIVAATPAGKTDLWQTAMTTPTVIAVGTEKEGLSEFWLQKSDSTAVIPMAGLANSLNVAQAATLFLYEAQRQRLQGKDPLA